MLELRSALKERGVTIAELCRWSGMPRRTIEDIIRRGNCMFSTAQRIACALLAADEWNRGADHDGR